MTSTGTSVTLTDLLRPHAERAEGDLRRWLIESGTPDALAAAMRYAALGGGKRLRPALTFLAAEAVGGEGGEPLRAAAVAVELVHTYSLVHDDLPAMDDDALRRGRPTVHVQYGQAMGVLVGDALLTRAFGLLAERGGPAAGPLAAELAAGAGPAGMIAGQVADMDLCPLPPGPAGVRYIHRRKTAALLAAAVRMGGLCAGAGAEALRALGGYGIALGLAFQLVDDLLVVTGDAAALGKATGKDAQAGKRTAVSPDQADAARRRAAELTDRAVRLLQPLGESAAPLALLARALCDRSH